LTACRVKVALTEIPAPRRALDDQFPRSVVEGHERPQAMRMAADGLDRDVIFDKLIKDTSIRA
jgi:hypothetical protein